MENLNKPIQASAQFMGAIPKVDKSMSLRFITQELSDEEKVIIMRYLGKQGWLLFKENDFTEADIPKDNAPTDEDKSPAQRLRGAIFLLSQQKGISKEKFNEYYRKIMEKFIDSVKEKLT
jgi:hypothetical protein